MTEPDRKPDAPKVSAEDMREQVARALIALNDKRSDAWESADTDQADALRCADELLVTLVPNLEFLFRAVADWSALWDEKEEWEKAAKKAWQRENVLTWLHAEAVWHAEHHRAQVEGQGLSHALLLRGVPDLLKQVDAQAQRIREQDKQLALAADTLGSIWLYVKWRYITGKLTTEQRELWADAVDEFSDPQDRGPKVDRWWRDDAPAPAHDEVLDQLRMAMKRGPKPRLRSCVERWSECETGGYHPSCCRFPSSCSATVYDETAVRPEDLEANRG